MATRVKKIASPPVQTEEPTETRRQRFLRIGQARMARVLNSIRLLGNLASPNYEYSDQDVTRMRQTIEETTEQTLARFNKRKRGEKVEFEFAGEDDFDAPSKG
jgi:uncharacterized protein YecE (DUF72 family)